MYTCAFHRPLPAALTTLLFAATAAAQTLASVTERSTSCQSTMPLGSTVTIQATPPIVGETCRITTSAPTTSIAALVISNGIYVPGYDLTALGSPGCRLFAELSMGSAILQTFSHFTPTTHDIALPATFPMGFTFYAQAILLEGGMTTNDWLTSNTLACRTGHEPDLTPAQIAQFAPRLRFHPNETFFPMKPTDFIANSRFRHHVTGWYDQGYNKNNNTWVQSDSHADAFYGIPVSFINSFGLNTNGTNRRPRDANSGSTWNVFLQSYGAMVGDMTPNGDVSAYYHYRRNFAADLHEIQYWYFCGYNDSAATFNHQGDWEHVTVRVRNGQLVSVYMAAHDGGTEYSGSQLARIGSQPIVYVAKGSHAAYNAPGSYFGTIDQCATGGVEWNTSLALQSLSTQAWRNFAGAWGEVGAIATTTGPLGPWHKRNDP